MTVFLPHPIVQLQTYFFCDCELIVGGIPHACFVIIQGKQIMAQRRDCWKDRNIISPLVLNRGPAKNRIRN